MPTSNTVETFCGSQLLTRAETALEAKLTPSEMKRAGTAIMAVSISNTEPIDRSCGAASKLLADNELNVVARAKLVGRDIPGLLTD